MNLLGYEACGWCPPEDAVLLLAIVLTLWKMATVKIPSFVLPPCSWESYAKCSRGAAPARVSADNAHKGGKRSTTQGITWIRLLLLVGSLPCFLSAPAAARTAVGLGFDPAKRIPLLTDSNYTEWSWRVAAALVAMGVSVKILTMSHAQADLPAANANDVREAVEQDQEVKDARASLDVAKLAVQLHEEGKGESLSDLKDAVVAARQALADAKAAAAARLAAVVPLPVEGPFDNLNSTQQNQCFQLIVRTISTELDFLVMNYVPSQLAEVWQEIRNYFLVNTRGVRNQLKVAFFSMVMLPRTKFAEFKARIEHDARQLNSMDSSTVLITEDDKTTVLMNGVRRHHDETFRTTLDVLEQSTDKIKHKPLINKS